MDYFQQYTYRTLVIMIIAPSLEIVSSQNQEDYAVETEDLVERSQPSENGESFSNPSAEDLHHDSSLHNNEATDENNEFQDRGNHLINETSESKEPDNAQRKIKNNAVHDNRNLFNDTTPVVENEGIETENKITETYTNDITESETVSQLEEDATELAESVSEHGWFRRFDSKNNSYVKLHDDINDNTKITQIERNNKALKLNNNNVEYVNAVNEHKQVQAEENYNVLSNEFITMSTLSLETYTKRNYFKEKLENDSNMFFKVDHIKDKSEESLKVKKTTFQVIHNKKDYKASVYAEIQDLIYNNNSVTERIKRQANKYTPCSKMPPEIHETKIYRKIPKVKNLSKIEKAKEKLKFSILNRRDLKNLKLRKTNYTQILNKIKVKGSDLNNSAKTNDNFINISTNTQKKLKIIPVRRSMQHVLKWLYEVLPGNHTIHSGTLPSKDMQTILNWINKHAIPGVHFEMTQKNSTELYDEINVRNSENFNLILNWINGYKGNNLHATSRNTQKRYTSNDMTVLINWINDQKVPGFRFINQYDDKSDKRRAQETPRFQKLQPL